MGKNKNNWNNGKDLMPEDILIEPHPDNKEIYIARLAFQPLNEGKPKFYVAVGKTKKEARHELIDVMIEHLSKLR